ncbi:TPA: hypothetical protein EYP66_12890 [Candidatus Poribacteria bacterium]|nr:hypothetical protein [Candidatus Poribacteria bacterium]
MRVLFSPLGMSYGSLFSAIVLTKPDHVVVITSKRAAANIPQVVEQAKPYHPNFTLEYHTLADPFTGFLEGRTLAKSLARKAGDENIANLVGGTTALQDAVKCLSDLIGAREVAVIDRRPIEEQRANPFFVGELVEVLPMR